MDRCRSFLAVLLVFSIWLSPFGTLRSATAENKLEDLPESRVVTELSAKPVGTQARALMLRINKTVEDGRRYKRALVKASTEDRLVLQLQIFSLQKQIMTDVHRLADLLVELEKIGAQTELRNQVESLCENIGPYLWTNITDFRKEIDSVRAKRHDAGDSDRLAIENDMRNLTRQLDTFFEISHSHIGVMERLGMNVEQARQDFAKLLVERSAELSGRLQLADVRVDDLEARSKEFPDDSGITKQLIAAKKSLDTNMASMDIVLDIMDEFKLYTIDLREQLVLAARDISFGLSNTSVAVSMVGRAFGNIQNWLIENGLPYLGKLIIVLLILFVTRYARRIGRAGTEKAIDSSSFNFSQLARRMIVKSVSNLILAFGILFAFSQLGVSLAPIIAGLGVAGFVVGFALQDTLGNFASGMMILLYRPYDINDLVDVSGVFGKVNKMSLVSTTLLTLDNQTIIVPNSKIWGDVIKNVTAQDIRRVDMVFGISYSDDIPQAESILNDILTSDSRVLDTPEPIVRVNALGESSVDFVVRPWVKVDDYLEVYWGVTKAVKLRFDEHGVSIPFPQRDVHVYNDNVIAAASG